MFFEKKSVEGIADSPAIHTVPHLKQHTSQPPHVA